MRRINYIPWLPLIAIRSKMVVHDCDLHVLVMQEPVIVSKKDDLVLVFELVVGDGDIYRTSSYIKKTILTLIKCIVV